MVELTENEVVIRIKSENPAEQLSFLQGGIINLITALIVHLPEGDLQQSEKSGAVELLELLRETISPPDKAGLNIP